MSWIFVTTLLLGFYMAWNIGANDVANAMGTSVGSKALTLKRAVFLAAILEFSGAFFAGSSVSETIQHGIVSPSVFELSPDIFVLGMLGSLLATGLLLQLASYFGLPISTTHAIVGAVIGFGTAIGGVDAIQWGAVGKITASWVLSPLLSGIAAYWLYTFVQRKIIQAANPFHAAQKFIPLLVFSSISIASYSLVCHTIPSSLSLTLSLASGSVAGLASLVLARRAPRSVGYALFSPDSEDSEKIFISLQILTACMVAFAHGANDVANAIGPVAAILNVLNHHSLTSSAPVPLWLLALGGGGIVIGLATWGWRVIETIGKKITELSPTRGFCAEFGAAVTILVASKLGLPISTTHALVGAVFGVGLVGGLQSLNFTTLKEIVVSWIVTIPLCAALSILCFYFLRSILLP